MGNLIDGRSIAEKVYVDLRGEIAALKSKGITPGLAVVLVGDDPASRACVRSKDKMSRELGLHSVKLELPESTSQADLLARVEALNMHPWNPGSEGLSARVRMPRSIVPTESSSSRSASRSRTTVQSPTAILQKAP